MSIPLDRLYHYIESIAKNISDDILIYRFYPHGSKKLSDLVALNNYNSSSSKVNWIDLMSLPSMICHDQEPLDYYLYTKEEFWNEFVKITHNKIMTDENLPGLSSAIANMHIRSRLCNPFNCYDKILLCHSEKNSLELQRYESNGFVGVYWWSHAVIALDWFRYAKNDLTLKPNFDSITKDFLVYNRAWSGTREYRLLFSELIANNNLSDSCHMKFSPLDNKIYYSNYNFKNKNLSIQRTDLENIYPLNTSESCSSADYKSNDYATSGIEIVLETLFDDQRNHLTEKTLRPIACGRPFMLASTPGSLKYLQDYGFETFHNLIDESYDKIIDPVQRLNAIVYEMQRIKKLDYNQKLILWEKLYKISIRNQQKFFSSQWEASIINEYSTNLQLSLKEIKKHITGKYWKLLDNLGKNNPEYVKLITIDNSDRTVQQREQLLVWLQERANK
jgi:hypothetical protein